MERLVHRITIRFLAVSMFVLACSLFFVPQFTPSGRAGNNSYRVILNGTEVGTLGSRQDALSCLRQARREIAHTSDDMIFIDAKLEVKGENVLFGALDDNSTVIGNMKKVLSDHEQLSLTKCYTVKIGEYTVNMRSAGDVVSLLKTVLSKYDSDNTYLVNLVKDDTRQINVYTPQVLTQVEQQKNEEKAKSFPAAGIDEFMSDVFSSVQPSVSQNFDDYKLGLQSIDFGEAVEIGEAYMPQNQIASLDAAVSDVTGEVARNQIHEVQQGDTLSGIAEKYGLTTDQLIAINPILSSGNSTIRPGDELTVTVAEPKLSVIYTMQEYKEEDYTADTIYKDNDSWYTTKSVVIQEPSTGHRKAIELVRYKDGAQISSEIVMQQTTVEAVPKIIERGTVNPPTYIWPVSGGYITSSFGRRKQPKAGASTNHPGIDIGVPIGTSVSATSGGTVITAGWQSGYGNVVYIQHPGGLVSRYGHLSRILVKTGQSVSQGQKIALSGNTGNSTGPHLHFEMRMNGVAVNPLGYVNR